MENSIYLGLSRQMVLQTNMDIVANNIANMNTSGFRGQNPIFEEFLSDPKYADDELSFVYDFGQYQVTDPGPLTRTDNPLNVALKGPGFMGIQMPNGETGYTRDGNFHKNTEGILVNASGMPVMGQGGPITIPDSSTEINIDEKGIVSDQDGTLGQLMIVEFENIQELEPTGNNVYKATGISKPAEETVAEQGFLEGSNINSIVETTRMISILRDFQSTHQLLEGEHDRLRSAIQKLTGS